MLSFKSLFLRQRGSSHSFGFSLFSFSSLAKQKRVLVPVASGAEEIEAVTIIDTLVRAGADVTVAKVSERVLNEEESLEVTMSRGVKLVADLFLSA